MEFEELLRALSVNQSREKYLREEARALRLKMARFGVNARDARTMVRLAERAATPPDGGRADNVLSYQAKKREMERDMIHRYFDLLRKLTETSRRIRQTMALLDSLDSREHWFVVHHYVEHMTVEAIASLSPDGGDGAQLSVSTLKRIKISAKEKMSRITQ